MITDREEVLRQFTSDVATHELTVLRDDGVYRHLRFRRPGTYCMGFDILTWPGYLAVTGDMGEYVFTRITDMFEFFRNGTGELKINPSYWAEKCQAADRNGKIREFSRELFQNAVEEWLTEFCDGDADMHATLSEELNVSVYPAVDDYPVKGLQALGDIEHNGRPVFQDFWEVNCDEYTHHYLWVCYAIAWGVRQYDGRSVPAEEVAVDA